MTFCKIYPSGHLKIDTFSCRGDAKTSKGRIHHGLLSTPDINKKGNYSFLSIEVLEMLVLQWLISTYCFSVQYKAAKQHVEALIVYGAF